MKTMLNAPVKGYGTLGDASYDVVEPFQQPRTSRKRMTCIIIKLFLAMMVVSAILCVWVIFPLACFMPVNPPRPNPKRADFKNQTFAVGFDLTAGYGTAAVIFENGSIVDVGSVPGSQHYNEVLAKMSLESYAHPTPPYYNCDKQMSDLPRQWKRYFNKRVGRAASNDVGALGEILRALSKLTNTYLQSFNTSASFETAFVTVPLLPAIYHEDLADAAEYAGFQMLTLNFPYYRSGDAAQWPVSEFNTAYAGNGFGLKTHNHTLDPGSYDVLNVLFTNRALTAHVGPLYTASYYFSTRGITNFELGLGNETSPGYWENVRDNIKGALSFDLFQGNKLKRVIVHGDQAHDETFSAMLKEEVLRAQADPKKIPEFSSRDPIYAAARGAAFFAQWCTKMEWYMDCFPRLTPEPPGW